MNMLIITDSLGMPRPNVKLDDTWPCMMIDQYGKTNRIFTFCRRGVTTNELVAFLEDYTQNYAPDVIIIQMGIVDCVRRAVPSRSLWFRILNKFAVVSRAMKKFVKRNHYACTRFFDYHNVSHAKFKENMSAFVNEFKKVVLAKNPKAKLIFIPIAGAGAFMREKIYNVNEDIDLYNTVFKEIKDRYMRAQRTNSQSLNEMPPLHGHLQLSHLNCENVIVLNPYQNYDADKYVLEEDGHHLNKLGNELVFQALNQAICMS